MDLRHYRAKGRRDVPTATKNTTFSELAGHLGSYEIWKYEDDMRTAT